MFGFCPLASGSKGNAIYVGTKSTRILIDAGISFASLTNKLSEIDVAINTIQAVLVTHEHGDHIRGLSVLCERLNIPVLANAETARGIRDALPKSPRFKIFTSGETFVFGDLEIRPFGVPHDTLEPVAFTMKVYLENSQFLKLGFCADLGYVTSLVQKELSLCDYLYIEANHHPNMVHASNRPATYRERVLGRQGHLSNQDCAKLLEVIAHQGLKHVHLAHLSSECNSEELALKIVQEALDRVQSRAEVSIAHQEKISKCVYF